MSWKEFDLVRLTKLNDRSDIEGAPRESAQIPTDRCVVGFLQVDVEVGQPVILLADSSKTANQT